MAAGLKRKAIENYYYNKGNTGKSFGARWLDRLLVGVFVVAVVVIWTLWRFSGYGIALAIGLLASASYYGVDRGIRRTRVLTGRESILQKEKTERFQVLVKDQDVKGFYLMLRSMLVNTEAFSDIELVLDDRERPIIMEGHLGEDRIGICCRKVDKGGYVDTEHVVEFVDYCTSRGLSNGLYITNGYFDSQAKRYMVGIKDFRLYSADIDTIYKVFLKDNDNHPIKGIEKDIELKALEEYRMARNGLEKAMSIKRAGVYLMLGLVLAVYSRFVPFSGYYIFVSIIMLCFSATTLIRWSLHRHRNSLETEIGLDVVLAGLSEKSSP
jgi:hypothetical protein